MLSVRNVSFTYPGGARPALSGVSLDAARGEYIAVLGANGSGKSTLARCVTGLLVPDEGAVSIDSGHRVPAALVFQSPTDQIVAETVELDVAFGPENLGVPRPEMLVSVPHSIEAFGLGPYARESTHGLTAGRKQRLALAGATILDPAVLVLDEPSSMLSPLARDSLLSFLDRFHGAGGTVIHVTHDLGEASRADRVIVMDEGGIVFDGPSRDFSGFPRDTLSRWGLAEDAQADARDEGPRTAPYQVAARGTPAIECRSVSLFSLEDFSLSIMPGTVTAIMGESGSGKTLLLELLAGLRAPDRGSIERACDIETALAVQESEASLFAEFVADDVAYGPRNQGLSGPELVARVSQAMDMVGLPFDRFADRRTFSLSGGERRKAALAGIIAMNADVVLLDEPSSALDVRSRAHLLALIRKLKHAGKTVVFTTNREEECAVADAVITLSAPSRADATAPARHEGPRPQQARTEDARQKRARKPSGDLATLERLRRGMASRDAVRAGPLHRLPPALKYWLAISLVVAALAVSGIPALCALIALEAIPLFVARYPAKRLAVGLFKILPWLMFFAVIQYLIVPDPTYPALFILRFVALYVPLVVFTFVTSHTEIMYGMEDLLYPLRVIGFPVRDVSLVTGIVFRFIPLLYDEAARITTARVIRGAGRARKDGLVAAILSMASLFVPLILRTLTRAERLAEAITARYYGAAKNSRYLHWKTGIGHLILGIAVPGLVALLIFASYYSGK